MSTKSQNTGKRTPPKARPGAIDFGAALSNLTKNAEKAADTRFATAAQVLSTQSSALQPVLAPITYQSDQPSPISASSAVGEYEVGKTYAVPIKLIDPNPVGARHFYRMRDVEEIVLTMADGGQQDVAANGFVSQGRVQLIDGGTRLRAARSSGYETLDVKIEEPPANLREQFKRSARLNDNRNPHTALDIAVNFKRLIENGVYSSQDELAADMTDVAGKPLLKSQVSQYMRIARIPERLLQMMSENESTSNVTQAYLISGIFETTQYKSDPQKYDTVVEDIISVIAAKKLNKEQTASYIDSVISGKKERASSSTSVMKFGDKAGSFKVFPTKGQIVFTMQGLDEASVEEIRTRIERALAGQMPL